MDDQERRELENPESWDDESAELHPAVESPRAVVSVSFSRADLQKVSEFARAQGKKVSTFIREAALQQVAEAEQSQPSRCFTFTSGQGGFINQDFTAAALSRVEVQETAGSST